MCGGVNSLAETVEDVLEVVKVVPLAAGFPVVGVCLGHGGDPAIVFTHSLCEIATVGVNTRFQITGSNANVSLKGVSFSLQFKSNQTNGWDGKLRGEIENSRKVQSSHQHHRTCLG